MKRLSHWAILAFVTIGLTVASCVTPSQVSYFKDMEYGVDYNAKPAPELVLQSGDRISIRVYCEDPTLAIPFNEEILTSDGNTVQTASGGYSGYTVDNHGNIDFPVLGLIHIQGKTIKQVKELISDMIRDLGYIKNPMISVKMENFQITIIGEMNPSVLVVSGESITLLEALASATAAQNKNRITDVTVVRTVDGKRTAYSVNLQKKDLFDSPVYYLQQNDIVYVKRKGWQIAPTTQTILQAFTMGLSVVNTVSTILLLSRQ